MRKNACFQGLAPREWGALGKGELTLTAAECALPAAQKNAVHGEAMNRIQQSGVKT
jgi:hypothetical protein